MQFGKVSVEELENIDFKLPEDNLIQANKEGLKQQLYIGCAKWGRKDWVGKLYPQGTKEKDFLTEYSKNFNSIELNATFYNIPTKNLVKKWKSNLASQEFVFCPKITNVISHFRRLRECDDYMNVFFEGVLEFEDALGPSFLQLPPNFTTKNAADLKKFVENIPTDFELFVEFRHHSWFDQEVLKRTSDFLNQHKIGLVITDTAGRRDCAHMRICCEKTMIRFVGNSLHPSDYKRCDEWIERLIDWQHKNIKEIYFFMHQHDELHSPELITYMINKLHENHLFTEVSKPKLINNTEPTLF